MLHPDKHIKPDDLNSKIHLWNGHNSNIYENILDKDDQTLIKLIHLSGAMNDRFYAEQLALSSLSIQGIRKIINTVKIGDQLGLILQKIPGNNLKDFLSNRKLNLLDFLELSIQLCEIIKELHFSGWLHLNLNTHNVIISEDLKVHVIGFSKATKTPSKIIHTDHDILPYCAPEQTGRINRLSDERTDCYSLGVIFYEMLSGILPHNYSDKSKLIHSIITVNARSLLKENFDIPEVIDQIITSLLTKDPNKRYQNVNSLFEDLKTCHSQLKHDGNIKPLKISAHKNENRFRLSQKLYGRQVELEQLLNSYERVFNGETEIVFIASQPGMGKTSLVYEIQNHVAHRNGKFISGKYDQFQQNIPNLAISEAIRNLVIRLLGEDDHELDIWKNKIHSAIGNYGKLITDLVPDLVKIIGQQPEIQELDSLEAQNRFNFAFKEFIKIFASPESPLIIFLDDIQWSDYASLELIKWLLNNRDMNSLMIICAYRLDEKDSSHLLKSFVGEVASSNISHIELELKNLALEDINGLLIDSFGSAIDNLDLLSTDIDQITKGNPFFIKQMLVALKDNDLLYFDSKSKNWIYKKDGVFNLSATEDVIDLLIHKINKLDLISREILNLAACVGNKFEIEELSKMSNKDHFETIDLLKPIAEHGLIERQNGHYIFSHDKIQQAAYAMVDDETKPQIHFKIGKLLLEKYPVDEGTRKLFDIAYHVNNAKQFIDNDNYKEEVININYKAAVKAKQSNSFDPGSYYLEQAIELLGNNPWIENYDITIQIFQEAADIAFLRSEFESADYYVEEILHKAKSLGDKIPAFEVKIMSLRARSRLVEAVDLVEDLSGLLNIKFPSSPGYHHILKELIKMYFLMARKKKQFFYNMPDMTDQNMSSVMRILARHDSTTYIVNPKLTPLVLLKQLEISIKHGMTPVLPSALLGFGAILIAGLGRIERGYYYGNVALDLVKQHRSKNFRSRVIYGVMTLIYPWKHHLEETLDPLMSAHHYGLEDGDQEHASYSLYVKFMHQLFMGTGLKILMEEIDDGLEVLTPLRQEIPLQMVRIIRQFVESLINPPDSFSELNGEWFNEDVDVSKMEKSNDSLGASIYYLLKGFLYIQDGQYSEAIEISEKILPYWNSIKATYSGTLFQFQSGLLAANSNPGSKKNRGKLAESIKYLKTLSKTCPENNLHKYQLLLAEKYRIQERHLKAKEFYDLAIDSARKSRFLHEEALCYELAGKYYLSNNNNILKDVYLQKAYDTYLKWGAIAKSKKLLQEFASSISEQKEHFHDIDMESFIKTASILSEEVNTKPLIRKLLPIVVQTAGAQKGILITIFNNKLIIKAGLFENGDIKMFDSLPLSESKFVSQVIVKYVARTGKSIIIDDAANADIFKSDPYIIENKLVSVSCIPLLTRSKVIALLYLENNLIPGAFKQESIELLKVLSGHMAISLSNAEMHENLEAEVLSRTSELEKEKKKSDELLLNILPESTARELKEKGKADPLVHNNVSVLFTDIKGFTALSESLTAKELVSELDYCFRNFDKIIGDYGLEKIKTIGDAYMCAGGVPLYRKGIESDVIRSAMEILKFMNKLKEERIKEGRKYFEIRVGIHTGTVIAGIVGTRKFTYDIWGDTVNIASRIESHGEVGKLNISENTYKLIKDTFNCEFRGKIDIKNKGEMPIYRVISEKI